MRAGRRPKAKPGVPLGRHAAPSAGSARRARSAPRSGVTVRAEVRRASDADLIEEALAGSADTLSEVLDHYLAAASAGGFGDAQSEAHRRAIESIRSRLDAVAMARTRLATLCDWLHSADRTALPPSATVGVDQASLADTLETVRNALTAYLDDLRSDAEMSLTCQFGEGILQRSEDEIEALSRRLDARYAAALDLARRLG